MQERSLESDTAPDLRERVMLRLLEAAEELVANMREVGPAKVLQQFHPVEAPSQAEQALQAAAAVLEGNASPLVELRREELAAGDPNRALREAMRLQLPLI